MLPVIILYFSVVLCDSQLCSADMKASSSSIISQGSHNALRASDLDWWLPVKLKPNTTAGRSLYFTFYLDATYSYELMFMI